ncbi:MAG: ATP-binding protein, partial [Lacisediminihabitans sp.]
MHERLSDWWGGVSLRTKITGVTVLLVTLGLLVAGVGTMTALRSYLLAQVDSSISSAARDITTITSTSSTTCEQNAGPNKFFFAVLDTDGNVECTNLSDSTSKPVLRQLTMSAVMAAPGQPSTVWDSAHDRQWRIIALPGNVHQSAAIVTIVVGESLDSSNATIQQFTVIFLGFGLSVVILGAALTRLLVTSTFAPLREVEATAAAIAGGDFSQRLPGATPNTEVGRLNRSLNTMLGRIDRAFADRARTIDQMRRFVGDASHELRTPLVSVRGYAELYRMGALQKPEDVAQAMERIEKEATRMGELVSDLLELARLDEAKPLQLAPVDLLPIAHDAALDAMASSPDRLVTVVTSVEEPDAAAGEPETTSPASRPAPVRSSTPTGPIAFAGAQLARLRSRRTRPTFDQPASAADMARFQVRDKTAVVLSVPAIVLAEENKIRQVVTNLIGNAVRFTPDGSPLELGVRVDPKRQVAMLDIIDHGPGVPPQIREKIFQRFWRADSSRTRETGGSGLGLAIVSGIVAAHKGQVTVIETPGGGATFRVTLPLL